MPGPRRSAKKAKDRKVKQAADQMDRRIERRGGYRAGAGRPPGTVTVVKRLQGMREITEDIIREGKVPLRVMIKNMMYYDEKAIFIQEEMEAALAENMKRFNPDQFEKCLQLMVKLGDARMSAQKCACDAAPFLHARLSSMEMNVHKHDKPKDLPSEQETSKFSDDFRQLRSQPYVIEQEVVDVDPEGEDA